MTFEVTILGSNSALPAHGRFPTAQIVNFNERLFLVDCGEAAQIQLSRYRVRISKIERVFISHMHGDHYFGLIGLLTSYNLYSRETPLHIYCPEGLQEIIELQLKYSKTVLCFEVQFHPFTPQNGLVLFEDDNLKVISVEMVHRVPCSGFVFHEKVTEMNIKQEKIAEYQIPFQDIPAIKRGADWTSLSGQTIPNSELTHARHKERKYAFCTDTSYNEAILPYIDHAELLYHEATFDASRAQRAKETFHCTSEEAALIAQKANAGKLLIGHFSSRYRELEMEALVKESQAIFPSTELATEGKTFEVMKRF